MRLFISYSSSDIAFTRQLYQILKKNQYDVWLDKEDIRAGEDWSDAVQNGLDDADIMLLIVSPESMASPNVADEWKYYHSLNKPILPIRLSPAKLHFQLHRLQYVDFHEQDFDMAFALLQTELEQLGVVKHTSSEMGVDESYQEALRRIDSIKTEGGTNLDLSDLGLSQVPSELWNLHHLRWLDLSGNNLSNIPLEIVQLQKLQWLYVSRNHIRKIPPEIMQLQQLQKLFLDRNQLRKLPSEIMQLNHLTHLRMQGNQFSNLPPEIGGLPKLTTLWVVDGNPLTDLPQDIVAGGDKIILQWLRGQAKAKGLIS